MAYSYSFNMPVFNGGEEFKNALDSVLSQTHRNFEVNISDNKSTDGTEKTCEQYASKYSFINYVRNSENIGIRANVDQLFELDNSSDYSMILCHDDYIEPNFLEVCAKHLKENKFGLICTYTRIFNEKNETMLIDEGCDTTGLSPFQRFLKYRIWVDKNNNTNSMACGLVKTSLVRGCRTPHCLAGDHIRLAGLSLETEFKILPFVSLHRRVGAASSSIISQLRANKIDNKFAQLFPYLIREYHFQRLIFSSRLPVIIRPLLSVFSLICYFEFSCRVMYYKVRGVCGTLKKVFKRY